MERFVYINIEPNNAGSVSNVSEGGLCFHSIAPVQANRTIRFWFSEHNRRIEIDGDLAWTDETRKTAGVRFTSLPAEAREPICSWITPPASLAPYEVSTPSVAVRSATPVAGARRLGTKAVSDILVSHRGRLHCGVRTPTLFRGFSGGLATGLFVSTLVAAAFLFHSYRRQFGVALIQLGEQVAARSQTQMQSVSSAPQSVLPPRRSLSPAPAPISVQAEKLEPQTRANPAKAQHRDLELDGPANLRGRGCRRLSPLKLLSPLRPQRFRQHVRRFFCQPPPSLPLPMSFREGPARFRTSSRRAILGPTLRTLAKELPAQHPDSISKSASSKTFWGLTR